MSFIRPEDNPKHVLFFLILSVLIVIVLILTGAPK